MIIETNRIGLDDAPMGRSLTITIQITTEIASLRDGIRTE